MPPLHPFRPWRYAAEGARFYAPPYDVISPDERQRLMDADPHNVVHLILPESHERAGELLRRWRDEGVLVRDDRPALYGLAQRFTGPDGRERVRHGVIGALDLQPYGPGLRPHERTHQGPKADRLRIMEETRANLSPVFVAYDDPEGRVDLGPLFAAPVVCEVEAAGAANRLHRLEDDGVVGALHAALAPLPGVIADGHHRYETALAYARSHADIPAARRILAFCAPFQDAGMVIFPTHRLIREIDPDRRAALDAYLADGGPFRVDEVDDAQAALDAAPADATALALVEPGRARLLTVADRRAVAAALPDRDSSVHRLDTAVLDALLLSGPLGLEHGDDHGTLVFQPDAAAAVDAVQRGEAALAFLLRPPTAAAVRAIAEAGEVMPPKSTYFYPKLPTGLVLRSW
jgi:uncharacterized protein (DUF1015 family)